MRQICGAAGSRYDAVSGRVIQTLINAYLSSQFNNSILVELLK